MGLDVCRGLLYFVLVPVYPQDIGCCNLGVREQSHIAEPVGSPLDRLGPQAIREFHALPIILDANEIIEFHLPLR